MATKLSSRFAFGLAALAVMIFSIASSGHGEDWSQWRGSLRDGIANETQWTDHWPEEGPKILWSKETGISCVSVAVKDGKVYTVGNIEDQDHVWCLDALTGDVIWDYPYPCILGPDNYEGGPAATPAIDDERIYLMSRQGDIICLNLKDGGVIWSKKCQADLGGEKPKWGFSGSPLLAGDVVIFAAGSLAALDKKTGNIIWNTGEIGAAYSSAVPFEREGKKLLALFTNYGLQIHSQETGELVVKHEWKTSYNINASTPIVSGDHIFISSGYDKGAALLKWDGQNIAEVWKSRVMRNKFSSSVLWEDHLYGFDENALKCVQFMTGEERWETKDFGMGTLLLAGGKLIVLGENGELATAKVDPVEFKPVARHQVIEKRCWVVPVLANGLLYVKNNKGSMAAIDLRAQ